MVVMGALAVLAAVVALGALVAVAALTAIATATPIRQLRLHRVHSLQLTMTLRWWMSPAMTSGSPLEVWVVAGDRIDSVVWYWEDRICLASNLM